jgi:hypothetical protein
MRIGYGLGNGLKLCKIDIFIGELWLFPGLIRHVAGYRLVCGSPGRGKAGFILGLTTRYVLDTGI